VKQYIQAHDLMKGKKELPNGEDTRLGITSIISVKVPDPQFEGQTKSKLGNSEVRPIVDTIVGHHLTKYFEENPHTAQTIIQKIIENCEIRIAMKKQRELEKKNRKSQSSSFSTPEKLAPCKSKDKNMIELYIVEGDSAGGSAKQGRDKNFQAILPLRGKVLNTEKAAFDKMVANNEIQAMRSAIGTDMGEDFNYEGLKYDKIVIMTDADVDGSHISILLLTFFYRYMKPLVEKGHIYMANPPLFKIQQGKKARYAYSDKERDRILSELGQSPKPNIQRYKGLGEMNPEQLWETTMDPEERTLFQVTVDDAVEAEKLFADLMGDDSNARKEYIQQHAHEATIDV
jgi:DNA gyrase subunit B